MNTGLETDFNQTCAYKEVCIMKATKKLVKLPDGLKIGERFIVSFDDPKLANTPHQGRLQDLSSDGFLCIDAPAELRPPRGTPVTIRSLPKESAEFSFASQIHGRRQLQGRLPVLLVNPPADVDRVQRRTSYRMAVTLKALIEWTDAEQDDVLLQKPGVLTNLSGGGAQIYMRYKPAADYLQFTLNAHEAFVEHWAKRQLAKNEAKGRRLFYCDPLAEAGDKVRAQLSQIEASIVHTKVHIEDARGPIYSLSLAFTQPHESCYRLVTFLERQSLQKGLSATEHAAAAAA
tara:strand:+ start:242 stop:1108 length:867 start_codon:yes stop_codon:yes gene_type:complete